MNNCEKQEWIDSYLFGHLEGEERRTFELLMEQDADFRLEVNLQAEIMVGVCTYRQSKQAAKQSIVSHKTIVAFKRYCITAAAVIAAFIMFNATSEAVTKDNNSEVAYNNSDSQIVMPYKIPLPIYFSRGYSALAFM